MAKTIARKAPPAVKEVKPDAEQRKWDKFKSQMKANPGHPVWKELALDRIRRDPCWWLEHYVYTSDQHDDGMRIKRFPMHMPHFKVIVDCLLQDNIVFAPKSSKILASWLASGLLVWKALFFKHSECYVQCINEKAVDYFINYRMQPIYDMLPEWQKQPGTTFKFCFMHIPAMGSFVEGIPSGVDKIRGRSPSMFVMDELAFIPEAKKAVSAALPRILGDAMFLGISTPNMRNFFYRRTHPTRRKLLEEFYPIPESPLTVVRRHEGQTEIFIHYTADPAKRDPAWAEKEKQKLMDEEEGYSEEAWQQEMELSFDVTGMPKLFPKYNPAIHEKNIKYNPFTPIIRGWDFGAGFPCCVFLQHNKRTDQIGILDVMMLEDCNIDDFATQVLAYCKEEFKPGKREGITYEIKYKDYCDYAGNEERDLGVVVEVLRRRYGIRPRSRPSKPENRAILIRNRLQVRKDGTPGIVVDRKATLILEGFRGAWVSKKDLSSGRPTGIPDKDNYYEHSRDALGYALDMLVGPARDQDMVKQRKQQRRRDENRRRKLWQNSQTGYSP